MISYTPNHWLLEFLPWPCILKNNHQQLHICVYFYKYQSNLLIISYQKYAIISTKIYHARTFQGKHHAFSSSQEQRTEIHYKDKKQNQGSWKQQSLQVSRAHIPSTGLTNGLDWMTAIITMTFRFYFLKKKKVHLWFLLIKRQMETIFSLWLYLYNEIKVNQSY